MRGKADCSRLQRTSNEPSQDKALGAQPTGSTLGEGALQLRVACCTAGHTAAPEVSLFSLGSADRCAGTLHI